MKKHERICKCGCGQIINTKEHGHYIIKNAERNSYFDKHCYKAYVTRKLQKEYGVDYSDTNGQEIVQDMIKSDINNGFIKYVEGR